MKKIVGAAVAAALVAGVASAEVSVSLNVRSGGYVFNKDDVSEDAMTIGNLDAVTGTDALTFKASNDYAGVTLNYNPKLSSDSDDEDLAKNASKAFWALGNGVELMGWVKPAEWLKIQVGATKDGYFTADQVKKDTDNTNWSAAGKYAFLYKPGVQTKNSTGYYLDSIVDYQNNGNQYSMADLTFKGVGSGDLMVRAAVIDMSGIDGDYNFFQGDDEDTTMQVAPGLTVLYSVEDSFKVNFDFQMISEKDIAFGIYGSPLMVENLTAMLGYTFSTNTASETDADSINGYGLADTTFHAIDLRLRYQFTDAFSLSNAFNYTMGSEDGSVKGDQGSKATGDAHIWDALMLVYMLNDKIWLTGDVQIDAITNVNVGTSKETVADLYFTAGVVFNFGKGAAITTGINTITKDLMDKTTSGKVTSLSMPIIFRVKL